VTGAQQLESFIKSYAPEVAAAGRAAFKWMRKRFPGATVLVYDNYNALVIGFGPSERASEAAFSIALYPRWVNLFFLNGAKLPDPHRLLKGSGKQVRSLVIERVQTLDQPAVLALIDLAAQRSGLDTTLSRPGKIAIRAVAAKQRPRRPSA
jgi:hypothetical protein